jgi:Tol biopolymer transport system component
MGSGAQPNRSTIVGWSLAAVMAAVAVWGWMPEAPAPDAPVTRVSLRLPRGQELAANQPFMDLSADGSVLVYSGEDGERGPGPLLVRRLDALDAVPIPGSEGALFPAVSPDNREVAFVVPPAFTMRVVQLQGGVSRTVADSGARWPRWSPEGDWLYYTVVGGGGTLKRVRPGGGVPEVLLSPDTTTGLRAFPEPMPRGRALLYTKQVARSNSVMVMDLVTRETREVVPGGGFPRYRAGFLFYLVGRDERTLMVVPFDVDRLEVRGEPVRLLEGLSSPPTVSETGRLLYTLGTPLSSEYEAVWVTREGQVAAIDPDWTFNPGPNNRGLALSPDGRRLAVSTVANGNLDVWLKELPRGPLSRLTTHPGEDVRPRWTPDGTGVTFVSGRAGLAAIYQKPASGTSDARLLLALDSLAVWEGLPSRDGTWLLARTGGTGLQAGGRDVWAIRSGVDSVPRGLVVTPFDEKALALSPDGRWLAYESDETGRNEVYVRPFPNVNADKVPVSIAGGVAPVWAHSGRELFYLNANREMIAATIGVTNGFAVSERTVLFTLDPSILFREPEQYAMYDIAPGDRRFVMLRAVNVETDRPELILVDNLFGELRAGREN